jgi:diguanylate cyclase (GGDEF)-like protein
MPDFYTIYLLVLLFGLSNCVIWGAVVYRYRDLYAARYWLAGSAAGVLGGLILSSQGSSGFLLETVGGNTVVILGFWLNHLGVRKFHGDSPNLLWAGLMVALCTSAMLATFHLWYGRNPLYTLSQSLPLFLTASYLLRKKVWELGAGITYAALAIACVSHWVIASGNILLVANVMPALDLSGAAALSLLVFLFAKVTWNFGFLISVIDHLHREVERLANEDDLTGLANRRLFMRHLDLACSGAHPKMFSLMLFDLDRFKTINDTHGHAAGDAALRHAATVFRKHLRSGDIFARLGGDEFCVLLPDTGEDRAAFLAERAVSNLKASPFLWRNHHLDITASIGIASSGTGIVEPDLILEKADRALYKTKQRGRNGVTVYRVDFEDRPSANVVDFGTGAAQPKRITR